ncbi:hypothetical protein PQX77_010006 [Marasmius sp. AFHP31]|nr:hypothetical protein PQX77_010006 [Marasmius sp. AFHP31]
MSTHLNFRSPQGASVVDTIVQKTIPQWNIGLKPYQRQSILLILDQQQLLCITATGDGKSALFAIPILVHCEITWNLEEYPPFNVEKETGWADCYTKKGVTEIGYLGISAFAYTHDNVTEARKSGINLTRKISECGYQLVCVDPEHLREPEWRQILNSKTFRSNIIFGCAEECHLIDECGLSFRPMFRHIGTLFAGRLPSAISKFALTATLQPGPAASSVCSSLGFQG